MKRLFAILLMSTMLVLTSSCGGNEQEKEESAVTLKISLLNYGDWMQDIIDDFQEKNQDIRIDCREYPMPDEMSYEKYVKTVTTEIMSNNASDILSIQGLPYAEYVDKGALKKLDEFIKNDIDINDDNYFMNIINGCKYNDSYYAIPVKFNFNAVGIDRSRKEETEKITYAEFLGYLSNVYIDNDSNPILPNLVPTPVYQLILNSSYTHFIDDTSGTADFCSDEFKQLLNATKVINEKYINNEITDIELWNKLDSLGLRIIPQTIGSVDDFFRLKGIFKNKITYINFPVFSTEDWCKYLPTEIYGISSTSKNTEASWKFIKFLISEDIQMKNANMPVNRKAFTRMLDSIQRSNGYISNKKVQIKVEHFTEDEINSIYEIINNLKVNDIYNNGIANVVYEEALDFYNGDRSIDDVTKSIQERIEIYLGE